ncbi:hypothetical protein PF005_g9192 [Phytophthora fragariae]|uniref:Protein ENHANCED DISEASE RESISTANCE 2 C-terminal domain-containing protein n=1 Tax=Phytophthora fragariae TaxID=53985 RepID=A0A6A3ZK87_9STRA|nr:hypothetical protein PF003_g24985 [Phytophthora fragariae]KAE8939687.1 hypothetical protein PF009_g10476 [Phytophthora fragariae]KAE9013441.1 hypothetical protein PF011_g8473 [Phytophthora fragariae]KAE9116642.1 hypothetical protein PF010_g8877 [Phytophthora fragariae]KAE9116822.1 hypothetical protein PF007_g9515 [Phytophthora fragariae]
MKDLKPLQPHEPEKCSADSTKSWKFKTEGCAEQDPRLRKMWSEPTWSGFQLRSKTYLQSKVKETSAPPLFELLWFEIFSGTPEELHHVCKSKKSFASRAFAKFGSDVPPLFVVTLIVPGTPVVAGVQYFARTGDVPQSEANTLWQKFLESDDDFRKERLKLVPTVHDGPWLVRKSVGAKPLIIARALETTFYQTPAYLEVVVDICSDTIAKHVTALCRSHSTRLTVDVGYVIEGRDEAELPEALLGCVQYNHLDLSISTAIAD